MRCLTVVDECTRECFATVVATRLTAEHVVRGWALLAARVPREVRPGAAHPALAPVQMAVSRRIGMSAKRVAPTAAGAGPGEDD